ncbi:MAG: DUF456 domain-containing protein [Lysobacteraceae bacterium]|jgi:uncharacterized protein YqgC (DUF456 family)
MDIALWALVVILILVGIAGTVLPALPGALFVTAGIVLGAWIDGFERVPVWVVVLCIVLALLSWLADFVAGLLGAKRVGAHPLALFGAAVGTVAGIFSGLWGLIFMPLLGAALGEFIACRRNPDILRRAAVVGFATWVGLLVGTAVKIALTFVMVGVFVVALLF